MLNKTITVQNTGTAAAPDDRNLKAELYLYKIYLHLMDLENLLNVFNKYRKFKNPTTSYI